MIKINKIGQPTVANHKVDPRRLVKGAGFSPFG